MNDRDSVPARRTVVLATTNRGKVHELLALLADLPIDLVTVSDVLPRAPGVVEDGATFAENAGIKARAIAEATALPTLADDSGLEVDALHGRPGVKSARYAGERATDAENNAKLLGALSEVPAGPGRHARFRCALAFMDPARGHEIVVVEGTCEGEIACSPRGTGGFGYDPIFIVREAGQGRTMAELSDGEKNVVSHRARAAVRMGAEMRRWIGGG